MAHRKPYRLNADTIAGDRAILQAVATLPDYAPGNAQYSLVTVQQLEGDLVAAQQAEERARRELAAARELVTGTAWTLHEAVNGMKVQVEAQYGPDSPALHAVGLKRRSEHKRPVRRPKKAA